MIVANEDTFLFLISGLYCSEVDCLCHLRSLFVCISIYIHMKSKKLNKYHENEGRAEKNAIK